VFSVDEMRVASLPFRCCRFERRSETEVTFDAPDMGLPASIWVAPEKGAEWFLDEVGLRNVSFQTCLTSFLAHLLGII